MPAGKFIVTWHDGFREPTCEPNPAYPKGIDLDISEGQHPACSVQLLYPAKRCGRYSIACRLCGQTVVVTTAGRTDDPRSVKLACMQENRSH